MVEVAASVGLVAKSVVWLAESVELLGASDSELTSTDDCAAERAIKPKIRDGEIMRMFDLQRKRSAVRRETVVEAEKL